MLCWGRDVSAPRLVLIPKQTFSSITTCSFFSCYAIAEWQKCRHSYCLAVMWYYYLSRHWIEFTSWRSTVGCAMYVYIHAWSNVYNIAIVVCTCVALHEELASFTSQKVFICVSSVLTWARSKPLDPVSSQWMCPNVEGFCLGTAETQCWERVQRMRMLPKARTVCPMPVCTNTQDHEYSVKGLGRRLACMPL